MAVLEEDWWGPGWIADAGQPSTVGHTPGDASHELDWQDNLFDVLQVAQIDAQSSGFFFSQLAMRNTLEDPLSLGELIHALRIADISGLSLPPAVACQLRDLVASPSPAAASDTAAPLLAAFGHDLPVLMELLRSQEARPSLAWADAALRAWLAGDAAAAAARAHARDAFDAFGASAGFDMGTGLSVDAGVRSTEPLLSVLQVRAAMQALEALFAPGSEGGDGAASAGPALALAMTPPAAAAKPTATASANATSLLFPPSPLAFPQLLAAMSPSALRPALLQMLQPPPLPETPTLASSMPDAAACLRSWLDACLESLLDGGGLARPHQREDLYGMLPYLRTAPSAATVERLYGEAWPPFETGAWAASPEATAGLLCVCVASGARLPHGALQREVSALEQMLLLLAPPTPGVDPASLGYQRPVSPIAKFLRGSAGGVGVADGVEDPLFPPSSAGPSDTSAHAAAGPRRLTAHGAFLALSAFHHLRHVPGPAAVGATAAEAAQAAMGGVLLEALVSEPSRLGAVARCRAARALLTCLPASQPRLLLMLAASPDGAAASPLVVDWEELPAAELLAVLNDAAAAARSAVAATAAASAQQDRQLRAYGLLSLVAHVVQLPGWPQRLQSATNRQNGNGRARPMGLAAITRSIESVLDVLGAAGLGARRADEEDEAAPEAPAGTSGGSAIALRSAAQDLLAAWLDVTLPFVEDGVRDATRDWGCATSASTDSPPRPTVPYMYYDVLPYDDGAAATAAPSPRAPASWTAPAPKSAACAASDAFDLDAFTYANGAERPQPSPPPRSGDGASPAPPAPMPPAAELAAALLVLRDAAATLDARSHQQLHRSLMWALQRLGSRASRCELAPADFAMVPELLLQIDSVGWVELPLEWAQAVVRHTDAAAATEEPRDRTDPRAAVPAWFRSLAWQDALRSAAVAGQLVQRARAEVLRSDGALVAEDAVVGGHGGDGSLTATAAAPSKARALLAAAQSLRSHLVGLLAARAAAASAGELRDAAVAWQAYGVPYDRAAMHALLGAFCAAAPESVAAAAASAGGGRWGLEGRGGGHGAQVQRVRYGPVGDAAQRLWAVCAEAQATPDEVDGLFAVLRQ